MLISNGKLSLERFVLEMVHVPSDQLTLPNLYDLVGRLDLSDDLIQQHIHFHADMYCRNLLCRTPAFDMLVLCWQPGQQSSIHDHAGSLNVTRVFRGELTSRLFEPIGEVGPRECFVQMRDEQRLGNTGFAGVDHDEIHQLANTSSAPLVTVHVYARPLKDITVYCPGSGKVEQVTLRYSLEDDVA